MRLGSTSVRASASRQLTALAVGLGIVAGCSSGGPHRSAAPTGDDPVWLCRPGVRDDPCAGKLDAEVDPPAGNRTVQPAAAAASSRFDCFYVYPTVSTESGPNADLDVEKSETDIAVAQAARFSSVCRVWAPMYNQVTLGSLFTAGLPAYQKAYTSVASAFAYYLEHFNHGRPFVLIGHSQGGAMLIRLLVDEIDSQPAIRRHLVVAIIAGANLQVPTGQVMGATLKHIPLCTSTSVPGCVIAYSSYGRPPPEDALLGRPGSGPSLMSLQTGTSGQQVACVNPAAVGGSSGTLDPYFPQPGRAVPWINYPDLYQASCRTANGATWLQVTADRSAGDERPTVSDTYGPEWGLHFYDLNLALGNLVTDVAQLESAYGA